MQQAQPATLAVGLLTAFSVWIVSRYWKRAPASLTGLLIGCLAFFAIQWALPNVPLGAQAGIVSHRLPVPTVLLPLFGEAGAVLQRHLLDILLTGVLLAVISSLETVLNITAFDSVLGEQTEPNRELVAVGIANIVCSALGGVPLAFLRARAIATVQAGGTTRLAAVAGCVTLGVLYYVGGPLLARLPLTVLAGLMVMVAFMLSDSWTRQLIDHWRRGDRAGEARRSLAIVGAACIVTLWLGFAAGVGLGIVLATLDFLRRMNRSLMRARYTAQQCPSRRVYPPEQEAWLKTQRSNILVLELEGALFFGNVERLGAEVERLDHRPSHLILDFSHVSALDATGAVRVMQLSRRLAQDGIVSILASIHADSRHGASLLAHSMPGSAHRWAEDVDRAVEQAELALLKAAGRPLEPGNLALEQCDLLRGLEPADVEHVRGVLKERRLTAGERLFAQGDPGEELFILTSGSLSIVQRDAEGRSAQRFVSFSPGMMFGEVALLDGSGRSADAIADVDSVVFALHRTGLEELERIAPQVVVRLYRNMARHLSGRLRAASATVRR